MSKITKRHGAICPTDTNWNLLVDTPDESYSYKIEVDSISIVEIDGTGYTYDIAFLEGSTDSADLTNKDYLAYQQSIDANETIIFDIGIKMTENDTIWVKSSSANKLTFQAWGTIERR